MDPTGTFSGTFHQESVAIGRAVKPMALVKTETAPTRQWSCSTLLRGASFLAEQKAQQKDLSFEEVIGVSRLHRARNLLQPERDAKVS